MNYIEFLQERAFSMGYVQRMFDEKEENKEDERAARYKTGKGLAVAGTVAQHTAGIAATAKLLQLLRKAERMKELSDASWDARNYQRSEKLRRMGEKLRGNAIKVLTIGGTGLAAGAGLTGAGLYMMNKNRPDGHE